MRDAETAPADHRQPGHRPALQSGGHLVYRTDEQSLYLDISQTDVLDEVDDLYIALTGDQCALTDIHATPDAKPDDRLERRIG